MIDPIGQLQADVRTLASVVDVLLGSVERLREELDSLAQEHDNFVASIEREIGDLDERVWQWRNTL